MAGKFAILDAERAIRRGWTSVFDKKHTSFLYEMPYLCKIEKNSLNPGAGSCIMLPLWSFSKLTCKRPMVKQRKASTFPKGD